MTYNDLGRWANMRFEFIKQHRPQLYQSLLKENKLHSYLVEFDRQVQDTLILTEEQMRQAEGITEELKRQDQLEWVCRMNNISIEEYPWYCDISNIPDDPKNVTMSFRDRVDEENGNADKDDALLVVHKPEFQECPKPDDIIVKWLSIGWDDFRKEVKVVNSAKGDAAEDKKPEKGEEWSQQSMLADDSIQLKMDEETVIETVSDTENQENQETNNKEETFEP